MYAILQRLRRATQPQSFVTSSDGQMLERFIERRDDEAFESLIELHGPMVLGVCRRILRDHHDAEDAFQATFLVLARKAESIRPRTNVGNWLYGVAQRTAMKVRGMKARRLLMERSVTPMPVADSNQQDLWREIEPVFDQELSRLPEMYRTTVVLCDLEGKTQKEAAHEIGCTEGAVSMRLTRARRMLAKRLVQRGVVMSTGTLATLLAANASVASVPHSLITSTAAAAGLFTLGQIVPSTFVSTSAMTLTRKMLKAMLLRSVTKMVLSTALLSVIGIGGTGLVLLQQANAQQKNQLEKKQVNPRLDENKKKDAKDLALQAHAQAVAIDALPRCLIRGLTATVDSEMMKSPSPDPFKNLLRALDESLGENHVFVAENTLAWDQQSVITDLHTFQTVPGSPLKKGPSLNRTQFSWGTRERGGLRWKSDRTAPYLVVFANSAEMWKRQQLSTPNYYLASVHSFWWGDNMCPDGASNAKAFNPLPPVAVDYHSLPDATFDGELCHVVESSTRAERLWISQKTGLMRGALHFLPSNKTQQPGMFEKFGKSARVKEITGRTFESEQDYKKWHYAEFERLDQERRIQLLKARADATDFKGATPSVLVRFRDFREIAPGVWWPFVEDRSQGFAWQGGFKCFHARYRVEEIRTDVDLSEKIEAGRPKPGERVRDLRGHTPFEYDFSDERSVQELVQVFENLIGQTAPVLPTTGWIGGKLPDVAGRPHLVHLWDASCQPCNNDLMILKKLVSEGAQVIGLHPAESSTLIKADVEQKISDLKLGYPTYVAPNGSSELTGKTIAGYPADIFPYSILVDTQGNIVAHGSLQIQGSKILEIFEQLRK